MLKISPIDNLIAKCRYCDDMETAQNIQIEVISVLEKLGCSDEIIQSCRDLKFGANVERLKIKMGNYGYGESSINQILDYEHDLKEMIEILKEVRIIIDREDNYKNQKKSIRWAKIAAWAGIASVIIGLASIIFQQRKDTTTTSSSTPCCIVQYEK